VNGFYPVLVEGIFPFFVLEFAHIRAILAAFPRVDLRLVLQRTNGVEVWIDGRRHSATAPGLLILFGTRNGDREESCDYLADKAVNLRIFEDADAKMNLSALDVGAEIMVVSQFTLYADCHKGRRPGFSDAMVPAEAERLYNSFVESISQYGLIIHTGLFGARMEIRFANMGPVTILLEHDN
jgi:D-tyrosyl-tRNA(Tyr) deacylase